MDIRKIREEMRMGRSVFDLPLRVTFYARVSTDKTEQQGSLENQIQYYTDFIQKNPNWVYVPGYVDEGISGTSTYRRESFLRMIADAQHGRFDFIVTKEISRFSRNTLDSIQYTQQLLEDGVGVLFQNDNLNTLDTDSEFRLVVMAGVAQDEVRKLSERLKFGFQQSIKNGHVLGNDQMWGYDKKDCKLTIIPEQAEAVRLIFELYATGDYGLRKISQELTARGYTSRRGNAFNTVTIGHILTNPKYKGWFCGNKTKSLDYRRHKTLFLDENEWVMYPDPNIPAIVSEELWDRANAIYQQRSQRAKTCGGGYQNRYPYSGKIICGRDGATFQRQSFRSARGVTEYWRCRVNREQGKKACDLPYLYTNELNAVLSSVFGEVVQNQKEIISLVMESLKDSTRPADGARFKRLRAQLEELEAKKDRLLELSMAGAVTTEEFIQRNERFNGQIAQIQKQMAALKAQEKSARQKAFNSETVRRTLEEELCFSKGVHASVAASILDRVVVERGAEGEICLDVYLKTGQQWAVRMRRDPFVFSYSTSRNTTHRQPTSKTSSPSEPSD